MTTRAKSVSHTSRAMSMGGADPRWSGDWEPRTLHGNHNHSKQQQQRRSSSALHPTTSQGRRMMSGPALRRVDSSTSSSNSRRERDVSHERPRPISTGRLAATSSSRRSSQQHQQQQRDRDVMAVARSHQRSERELRHVRSFSSRDVVDKSNNNNNKSPQTVDTKTTTTTATSLQQQDSPRSSSTSGIKKSSSFREMRTSNSNNNNNNHPRKRLQSSSLLDHSTLHHSRQEEEEATHRLKQAEGKISSLMQELDELKFFSEIEAESPSPQSKSVQKVQQYFATNNTTPTTDIVLKQREVPTTTLSPRRLAGMDRTSLELEAQQLQRQVDILERVKASLENMVEMQDATATSRQEDVSRLLHLETSLKSVQEELSSQLQELAIGRQHLCQSFEEKLSHVSKLYKESQEAAEELLVQLEDTQGTYESLEKRHFKSKEEASRKLQQQAHQFQQSQKDKELKLHHKEEEISKLQQDLVEASMSLEVVQSEQQEEHEQALQTWQQEVQELKGKLDSLQESRDELQRQYDMTTAELQTVQEESNRQATELLEVQSKLSTVETEHAAELDELKTSLEDREKRRLDDLVALQQDSNKEYERRLQALQEQLRLATDRHQMEMEQKDKDFEVKLANQVTTAQQVVRDELEPKLRDARADVAIIQLKYEEAKQDCLMAQVKSESKDRDAAREWDRKDAIRASELELMHDKLDRTSREVAEKEAKIQQLQEKISNADQRKNVALSEIETQHADEIAAREELLASQRQLWKASEAKLRTELARKDSVIMTQQEALDSNTMELKKELDETRKELENVKKSTEDAEALKAKLATKQTTLEQLQKEIVSEQARHESAEEDLRVQLAKLEGRLSATETTLIEKKFMVDDLEQRLSTATEEKSTVGSKYENKVVSLQAELESLRNSLTIEQSTLSEKDATISKLERERQQDGVKLEQLSSLEKSVSTLQRALSEVETEKDTLSEELTKLQEERTREVEELHGSSRQIAVEKEEFSKVLEQKDERIKELTESHTTVIAKLESRLDEEKSSKDSLLAEMEKLKESLETADRISQSRGQDSMHFQQRINELEEQISQQRNSVSRNVAESQETVVQLKKQLAEAQKAQEEVAETLESLSNEKDEVVDALEQVLNEVQGRDEEIETLTDILEKRDEELEHAKIIATKAITQAQEIQNRYKERHSWESSSKADLESKIESLNVSLEFLASKNEDLQKKTARLEADLREKTVQIARLKEEKGSPGDYGPKENQGYTAENQNFASPSAARNSSNSSRRPSALSSRRSRSSPTKSRRKLTNGFAELDSNGNAVFSLFGGDDSLSSANKLDRRVAAQSPNDKSPQQVASKSLGGDFQHSAEWVSDFEVDFDSNNDFNEARSDPGFEKAAQQEIERDALRKYVRKRYLKNGESR